MRTKWSFFFTTAMMASAVMMSASPAWAQQFGDRRARSVQHPTTSPYLQLLRSNGTGGFGFGGTSTFGLDFYQLVRPEQQLRSAFQQQERQLNQLRTQQSQTSQRLSAPQSFSSQLGVTGHSTNFMNLGNYFSSSPLGGRRSQ